MQILLWHRADSREGGGDLLFHVFPLRPGTELADSGMAGVSDTAMFYRFPSFCFPEGAVSLGALKMKRHRERKGVSRQGRGQEADLQCVDSPPESGKQAKVAL